MVSLCCCILLGCDTTSSPPNCSELCALARDCAVLPSALGAGPDPYENCKQRCANSEDAGIAKSITANCGAASKAEVASWCEGRGTCAVFGACLARELGRATPIAVGSLNVSLVGTFPGLPLDGDGGSSTTGMGGGGGGGAVARNTGTAGGAPVRDFNSKSMCKKVQGSEYARTSAEEFCSLLAASQLSIVLESRYFIGGTIATGSCVDMLSVPLLFESLPVGGIRVAVRIEGSFPSMDNEGGAGGQPEPPSAASEDGEDVAGEGDGGQGGPDPAPASLASYCLTVQSSDGIVLAGGGATSDRNLSILLPLVNDLLRLAHSPGELPDESKQVYGCENTLELCSNGVDDDGDRRSDCAESECSSFCPVVSCIGEGCAGHGGTMGTTERMTLPSGGTSN